MKLVMLSDTHNNFYNIDMPKGDVLIFAGDFSSNGSMNECIRFNNWLKKQNYKWKLYIPGNHELLFEKNSGFESFISEGINVNKKLIKINNFNFFGFSYTNPFNNYGYQMKEDVQEYYFQTIAPNKVDILITHGPPFGILDVDNFGKSLGSKPLLKYVNRVKPKIHVFGHIHESYGVNKYILPGTSFYNVSLVKMSKIINKPVIVEI